MRSAGRLRTVWQALRRRASPPIAGAQGARFRLMYERFREILSYNDSTLQVIADIVRTSGQGGDFDFRVCSLQQGRALDPSF